MQIITGKTGTNHVASEDDRALHSATFGSGNYVLNSGLMFEATIETSNNIVLAEGDLLINGTHARIRHGETETVIIENGTTGYNRIDLIVARYTKSAGIEDVSLVVVKGEPTTGTATQPSTDYIGLNVLDGVEIVDMPLYAVQLSGVNVESVTPLFTVVTGLDDVYRKDEVETIKSELQTNINAAQTTANTGVTNASKAQSTANIAVSNAATAQTTANNALAMAKKGYVLLDIIPCTVKGSGSQAAGETVAVSGTSTRAFTGSYGNVALCLRSGYNAIVDYMNWTVNSNKTITLTGQLRNGGESTYALNATFDCLIFGQAEYQ